MLEVRGMSCWYEKGNHIIRDISFEIGHNQVIGLLGVNGVGKTTLIKTISGVHNHYSVEGLFLNDEPERFENNSFKTCRYTVFTEERAFGYWTFNDHIDFLSKTYKRDIDKEGLEELICGFSFAEQQDQYFRNMSTGNRKKAFLISGFALRLPLLILDEPLDGLDFSSAEFLYRILPEYKKNGSVLMSSHIAESIEKTCDRILLLSNGKIMSRTIDKTEGIDLRKEMTRWLKNSCYANCF